MRREWTKQEEEYMIRRYLHQPVKITAEKLNRTETSVKRKAARLGLNHYLSGINAKTIAKCFNSDVSVVIRWIEKFGLPCSRVKCDTQTRYVIDINTFWDWASEHKEMINWSKYEKKSLLPEPEWVKNQVSECPNSRKKFTTAEKLRIASLARKGLSYREIAVEMGRSYNSINHYCGKMYKSA